MGEVTRKTTVGGRGFHTGPIQLQKEIQDSLYRRHKALSLTLTLTQNPNPNPNPNCSVRVGIMASFRENLYDVYTMSLCRNIFQPSTFRKPARRSSQLNSEEDIDSGRESLNNSLSQQSIHQGPVVQGPITLTLDRRKF